MMSHLQKITGLRFFTVNFKSRLKVLDEDSESTEASGSAVTSHPPPPPHRPHLWLQREKVSGRGRLPLSYTGD